MIQSNVTTLCVESSQAIKFRIHLTVIVPNNGPVFTTKMCRNGIPDPI